MSALRPNTPGSTCQRQCHLLIRGACLVVILALAAGCSARLAPPQTPPVEPRQVVLLEHGRHTSLVLFDAQQVPWRFAYGDRHWYLEGTRGANAATRALLRDSPAVLGRRALDSPQPSEWQRQVGSVITAMVPFEVEGARVDALLESLQAHFDSATEVLPAAHLGLEVIVHPQPYRLGHNSNHVVGQWLSEVGVKVEGSPALGRWRTSP